MAPTRPAVAFAEASLSFGDRTVWSRLSMAIEPGSFVAVLGPNGSGKTSLLRAILGLTPLTAGAVEVLGAAPRRGNPAIGYIPQARAFDPDLPLRGRDLVGLGLDGHRWGFGLPSVTSRERIDGAIEAAGASAFATAPIGRLSGGEQQRLRVAQAVVGQPRLLLCDEPLAHLDLRYQADITELIVGWQRDSGGTTLFVTHDVNPILGAVDRVLFVVNGRWVAGTPDEVLTSERLTDLYGSHVDVLRVHDRLLVVGDELSAGFELEEPHHLPAVRHGGGSADGPRTSP
ncbi:MAG TPA: ATP-binding cassette domain-containing protein [Candidatus Binatus sp.]|nr:ATP-binding cassette domain-containing protein [Candidatus Binatus sp.]